MKPTIYLDNAAATKPCPAALTELSRVCRDIYGNPAALHGMGATAENIINESKKTLLSYLTANPGAAPAGDIIFTSGATESNNLAVTGAVAAYAKANKGGVIITTGVEHKSVAEPFAALSGDYDKVVLSPKDRAGSQFTDCITDKIAEYGTRVFFISVIAVNNETGACIDTARVCAAAKRANPKCIVHTDYSAGFLKYDICGNGADVPDLITVSALKCGGISGVGGLYVRKGIRLIPQIIGGGHQRGLRAGTEPVGLIAAFAAAAKNFKPVNPALSKRLTDELRKLDGIIINNASDYIVNFSFCRNGIKAETLVHMLEQRGIYVSAGSACNKGAKSTVLLNYGLKPHIADTAVRASFCGDNTLDDITELTAALREITGRYGTQTAYFPKT